FHLLLAVGDLEVPRAHGRLVKMHEHEPVPAHHPDPDRAEGRQVGTGVNVDGLQVADLVAVGVDHIAATPIPDILRLEHAAPPLQQRPPPYAYGATQICTARPLDPHIECQDTGCVGVLRFAGQPGDPGPRGGA